MKIIIASLTCLLFVKVSFAQKDLLSFDEHNKYIYYQVVDEPGLPADSLHSRTFYFLKSAYPKIKLKQTATAISGENRFVVFGGVSILKHEKGEIACQVNVEFKDQKYRVWLTGFTFTPYQRDRYGNFVPEQGIDIPLETATSKLEKKDVDSYLDETGAFCKQLGDRLKIYLMQAPALKKEETTKKVVTDKW
jgi:hypothetical protein